MTINSILEEMRVHGIEIPENKVYIEIKDANVVFRNALNYFLGLQGCKAQYLPEYRQIEEWLANNMGKGLFLYGNIGRGKTVISRYVIPAILLKYERKVVSCYDAHQMNDRLDELLKKKIICIDDVGLEELSVSYGNKRLAFLEVLDATEKYNKLLIVTSNLANPEQIMNKYGDRGMDRIISTMKRVAFKGKSLRK